ncbi:MAG: hypothetical protein ACE5IM_07060, partial [Nitrospinota bacterium]
VIPRRIFFDPWVLALVDTRRSPGFRVEVEGLGGYDGRESGRVVFSGDAPLEPAQDAAGDRVGGTGGTPAR